jgi:hypothetical protein
MRVFGIWNICAVTLCYPTTLLLALYFMRRYLGCAILKVYALPKISPPIGIILHIMIHKLRDHISVNIIPEFAQ